MRRLRLSENSGAEDGFFVSPFVDYASPDGLFRKYRVGWSGRALSLPHGDREEWKVWYLNADMALSAANRAEEARFMPAFDDDFGARHARALAEMPRASAWIIY